MAGPIIKVEGVSKKFIIGHEQPERYKSLRDVATSKVRNLFRKQAKASYKEEFWALRDLDFEINQGDRVGIIGRNGAGKSTLLKILSRITEPTKGRIEITGRIASLLEVGTGFHPELSGRENIFLNGAILGMSRFEIRKKFDEIVAFAEVERFLDTPVKRYSSGMYVRLAFAVAAHLEPEILIVDEVLAVGDAQFQKKCLGKMQDVSANEGRTVLFVSHNMSTLKALCSSLLFLKAGEIVNQGAVETIIGEYLSSNSAVMENGIIDENIDRKYNTGDVYFRSVRTVDAYLVAKNEFHFGEQFKIKVEFDVVKEIENAVVNLVITTITGDKVAVLANSQEGEYVVKNFAVGRHSISIDVMDKFLPTTYSISVFIANFHNGTPLDWVENVSSFSVSNVGVKKGGDYPWGLLHGYVEPTSVWNYSK